MTQVQVIMFGQKAETVDGEVIYVDSSKKVSFKRKGKIMIVLNNGDKKFVNDVYCILLEK